MLIAKTMVSAAALLLAASVFTPAHAAPAGIKNIVLVHGAWADGSGWAGVYKILTKDGYNVSIVTNPLTSLADDAAATERVIQRQDGPVILVGHSYGGAVITEAGDDPKVAGLVYVAAFAPDKGESIFSLLPKDAPPPPFDVSKDGFAFFQPGPFVAAFAAGVPKAQAEFLEASQTPLAIAAGNAPLTVAAWHDKPSWYVVSKNDQIIPPDAERQMAKRAGSMTIEMAGGHIAFVVDPGPVAALIEKAAKGAALATE